MEAIMRALDRIQIGEGARLFKNKGYLPSNNSRSRTGWHFFLIKFFKKFTLLCIVFVAEREYLYILQIIERVPRMRKNGSIWGSFSRTIKMAWKDCSVRLRDGYSNNAINGTTTRHTIISVYHFKFIKVCIRVLYCTYLLLFLIVMS